MKAYNLVIGRFFEASVCVTLYECPWHPYIESLPTLTSEEGLRKHLVSLENFCSHLNLEINTTKTKVSIFGKKPKVMSPLVYRDHELEIVTEYKYIGIWLTNDGKVCKAQSFLANQGKKAIFALQTKLVNVGYPPNSVVLKLFDNNSASTIIRMRDLGI